MISIVMPAHNESAVIRDTLQAAARDVESGPIDILVVCNGCTDDTAGIAASVPGVRVLESPVPSKVQAVNLGLREARGEVVVCLDADIRLGGTGVGGLARALERPGVLAAAPRAVMDYAPGTSWFVRAYYRVWLSLSYVSEGMVGCGVYALNAAGRARVGEIPELIADDGYVRASFARGERVRADDVVATVRAPRTFRDLMRIKTRSRLGGYQMQNRCPAHGPRTGERVQRGGTWLRALTRPSLWPCIPSYLYINILARYRARRQLRTIEQYVWERDESSRAPSRRLG